MKKCVKDDKETFVIKVPKGEPVRCHQDREGTITVYVVTEEDDKMINQTTSTTTISRTVSSVVSKSEEKDGEGMTIENRGNNNDDESDKKEEEKGKIIQLLQIFPIYNNIPFIRITKWTKT